MDLLKNRTLKKEKNSVTLSLILSKIAIAVCIIIGCITLLQNFMMIASQRSINQITIIFLTIAILCLVIYGIYQLKVSPKILLCIILSIGFLLRLIFILAINTQPQSDFELLYNSANSLIQGDLSWTEELYFINWAYQIPFILYEALILKIFNSIIAIKIVNLLLMTGTIFLIYAIVKDFLSEKAALICSFLYAIYPASILLSSVLTNQHVSAFFLYLGIYLLFHFKKWPWMLLAGLSLCIGNLMRPEAIVIIVSILAVIIWLIFQIRTKGKEVLYVIRNCVIVICAYFVVFQIVSLAFSATSIAPSGIKNNCPQWKFVVGLNPNSLGNYTEENADILAVKDNELRNQMMMEDIKENFQKYDGNIATFLFNKTYSFWASNETTAWSCSHIDTSRAVVSSIASFTYNDLFNIILAFDKGIYIFIFAAGLISAILFFLKKREIPVNYLFFSLLQIANYCVYLIIEIQVRYRYFIMPALFILAAYSFEYILPKLKFNKHAVKK